MYYPRPVSNAQLAISGPSTIPNCGTFTLVGHFSSPKGDAIYYWTAYRGDQRPLETVIANELLGKIFHTFILKVYFGCTLFISKFLCENVSTF